MELFLVELTVADWPASLAWYRDRLGLPVELVDDANRFALLASGTGRVALKEGAPQPRSAKLVFQVADLTAEIDRLSRVGVTPADPVRFSTEGYRSIQFHDLDGYRIELFEWLQ